MGVLAPAVIAGVGASIRYLVIRRRPELGRLADHAPTTALNAVRDEARRMTRVLVVGGLMPEGISFIVRALLAAVPALPRWGVWLPLCPPLALVAGLLGRPTVGSR